MSIDDFPDEPGSDNTQKTNSGSAGVGFGAAIIVGIIILSGWIYTAAKQNDPGVQSCSTSCLAFIRLECPGARYMGTCFGVSVCDQPIHQCGKDARLAGASQWASLPKTGLSECRRDPSHKDAFNGAACDPRE